MVSEPFRVLVVCTGNICRSPMAEQAFRSAFGTAEIVFESAGTAAVIGAPMTPEAARVAQNIGSTDTAHFARQLDEAMITRADLVLPLTREHRASVARLVPRATRYTFTVREAARLLESLARDPEPGIPDSAVSVPELLRLVVPRMAAQRGFAAPPPTEDDDDVLDPFLQDDAVYELAGSRILDAIRRTASAIDELAAARAA